MNIKMFGHYGRISKLSEDNWVRFIINNGRVEEWFFFNYSVLVNGVMYYANTEEFKEECKKIQMWVQLNDHRNI